MINTINEARTPGELAAWLRQWADGADASDHLDDNDARQLAEAVERVCAPGNAAAQREALNFVSHMDDNGYTSYDVETAIEKARSALAAPPRNCDRFEDGPDALDAYRGTLRDGEEVRVPWLLDWLFEPAKGGREMSDETKVPVRSIAEVIEIMQPVFEWATRDALKCAQLRDGLAVATDGRVLVRVELPGFRPTPEAAAGCVAGVLDFVPEEGRVVAGREWVERELAPHVEADWTEVRATSDRRRADEWTRANTRARRCPCCGAELVADADGDVWALDEWIRMEAGPSERDAVERVEISTNVGAGICVFLRDLARALDAARKLGGADALRIGRGQLRLDGAGFTVVVCRALPDARAFRRFLVERGAEVDGAANTPRNGTEART